MNQTMAPRGGARPGAGRPKKKASELMSEILAIPCTKEQKARWTLKAQKAERDLVEWARLRLG